MARDEHDVDSGLRAAGICGRGDGPFKGFEDEAGIKGGAHHVASIPPPGEGPMRQGSEL